MPARRIRRWRTGRRQAAPCCCPDRRWPSAVDAARDAAIVSPTSTQGEQMGETIKLKAADGFSMSAYVAGPADATKGVVVVQEIFGVNHHIRDMADRFAALGYAVVAPALFDRGEKGVELGYTQADIGHGREFRMKLDDTKLMEDVEAAAKHLGVKKIGIV